MNQIVNRRSLLTGSMGAAAGAMLPGEAQAKGEAVRSSGTKIKLSLNAYSFNKPLRDGSMTLEDLVDYCAQYDFDGLDATGYYFPGYPQVPSDETIYSLKRRAFLNGITVHGTGVRNDFAVPDPKSRAADVDLVKRWIVVAQKLGASGVRIFSGLEAPAGYGARGALDWMIPDMKECADYGRQHGVIVRLQNHNDFLRTAEETIRVVEEVDSEWFGVMLDIGSLREGDPYEEIEKLLPYAVSWQLKEFVWYGKKEVKTDLAKIKAIIDKGGYRGFLPIETLGAGDPKVKVAGFVREIREVFGPLDPPSKT